MFRNLSKAVLQPLLHTHLLLTPEIHVGSHLVYPAFVEYSGYSSGAASGGYAAAAYGGGYGSEQSGGGAAAYGQQPAAVPSVRPRSPW